MDKVYAGARALALLVAIVAAFVTVPQVATVLLVLGAISAIGNKAEDNMRVYLVATVFTVASGNLGDFVSIGTYLNVIFKGVAEAATGAAAVSAVLAITRMTMAAFAMDGAAAAPAKAAA